jgi:hypothetical protein
MVAYGTKMPATPYTPPSVHVLPGDKGTMLQPVLALSGSVPRSCSFTTPIPSEWFRIAPARAPNACVALTVFLPVDSKTAAPYSSR